MRKFQRISVLFLFLFAFTGCFQVLHFVSLNPDGTISINWRLTISAALSNKNPKKAPNMQERLKKANQELKEKLKDSVSDLQTSIIETRHEKGVAMQMTLLKPVRLEKQDGMPVIPFYEKSKKRLTFFFRPKKQGKSVLPIPPSEPPKPQQETTNQPGKENSEGNADSKKPSSNQPKRSSKQNQGMEELVKAILSSARYEILLGGKFAPKRAYIVDYNQKEKKTTEIEILKFGSQYFLSFPFMSFHFNGDEGYDLIVELE